MLDRNAAVEAQETRVLGLRHQCFLLMGYSLAVLLIAWPLDLHVSKSFSGYWQRPNWLFFPLYWPLAYLLVWATWDQFMAVWEKLSATGVMVSRTGAPVSGDAVKDVLADISAVRPYLIIAAVVFSAIANVIDVRDWAPCYWGDDNACAAADQHFNVAWVAEKDNAPSRKLTTMAFSAAAYAGQFVLGALAFLALIQIIFHTAVFAYFEGLKGPMRHGLMLRLNHKSNVYEFGLEYWNDALNNMYWLFCAALIVPLLSRASQTAGQPLSDGQLALNALMPVLLIAPMVMTIIVRQNRLPALWSGLQDASKEEIALYHAQKLWPLDKNWASKLGIILAFVMLSFLLGTASLDLLKKAGLA